jgi:hypothetical protein
VVLKELNAQEQPQFIYPASFPLSRAYLDQLERSKGFPAARISALRAEISQAEAAQGASRVTLLNRISGSLATDVNNSSDRDKATLFLNSVKDLAAKK